MTIWAPVMFCDELDMLTLRLEATARHDVRHLIVEAVVTHKGVGKPLHFAENMHRYPDDIAEMIVYLPEERDPWVNEHRQRDFAWQMIDHQARDDDWVLISDVDEIPSASLLDRLEAGDLPDPCSVRMRVFLYAVDWEVLPDAVPPQCVAATAGYIRAHGGSLAAVRDARAAHPVVHDGGWHMSWLGGPEAQRYKLHDKTCHTELLDHPEGQFIDSGMAYVQGFDGMGLPVVPVDVDASWPAMIAERRCPPEWFRPRGEA